MGVRRQIPRPEPTLPTELLTAFGPELPHSESEMWTAMSFVQRSQTLERLRMLLDLERPDTTLSMDKAATKVGVSLNRWYEIRADWEKCRSIASLGTFAINPRTRKLSHHQQLEELAVAVFDKDPTGSVRQHALALGEAYAKATGRPNDELPSHNTLRKFAETERRRRAQGERPGAYVVLDCCACQLPHSDSLFAAFLIIDRGTRIVLGAGLGDPRDSRVGYMFAGADAQDRLSADPLIGLAWADRLEGSEIVHGLDSEDWDAQAGRMQAAGLADQLRPATAARRFGVFVRPLIGARMGRVKFLPGQTAKAEHAAEPNVDDLVRFLAEVGAYNAELVEPWKTAERRDPPAGLMTLLGMLTNG